ncbi:MAG: hypothetical protein QOH49_3029 [Acidobacteriota bacterium]|jgi:hypothetical protein|nr:hypothetical protein [Acidobacteriota bacterium]
MPRPNELYQSDEEVEEVVRRFESCELPPADFNHREHLLVALFYLLRMGEAESLTRVRTRINAYVQAHGINPNLYHETITLFWLKRVRAYVGRTGNGRGLAELTNALAAECGSSRLIFDYYSKELIDSEVARHEWVEPDLRPLDF